MIGRKMNKEKLRMAAKISSNAMAKLGKDELASGFDGNFGKYAKF